MLRLKIIRIIRDKNQTKFSLVYTSPGVNHSSTEYKYFVFYFKFQTVAVVLEGGLSQRVTFLADDKTLEGILVFRIEFLTVTGANSIELQLAVLGCAEGKTISTFSQYRHVFKSAFHTCHIQRRAPFADYLCPSFTVLQMP